MLNYLVENLPKIEMFLNEFLQQSEKGVGTVSGENWRPKSGRLFVARAAGGFARAEQFGEETPRLRFQASRWDGSRRGEMDSVHQRGHPECPSVILTPPFSFDFHNLHFQHFYISLNTLFD